MLDHVFDELLNDRFRFDLPAEVADQLIQLNCRLGNVSLSLLIEPKTWIPTCVGMTGFANPANHQLLSLTRRTGLISRLRSRSTGGRCAEALQLCR